MSTFWKQILSQAMMSDDTIHSVNGSKQTHNHASLLTLKEFLILTHVVQIFKQALAPTMPKFQIRLQNTGLKSVQKGVLINYFT